MRAAQAACKQQHKGSGRAWKDGGMMTGLGVSDTLLPPCMSCSRCDAGAGELDAPSTWKPTTFRRGVGLLPMLLRCRLRSMPQHAARLSQLANGPHTNHQLCWTVHRRIWLHYRLETADGGRIAAGHAYGQWPMGYPRLHRTCPQCQIGLGMASWPSWGCVV